MNEEFKQLAKEIVANYRNRISYSAVAELRVRYLQQMRAELQALKEAYAIVYTTTEADTLVANALQS